MERWEKRELLATVLRAEPGADVHYMRVVLADEAAEQIRGIVRDEISKARALIREEIERGFRDCR